MRIRLMKVSDRRGLVQPSSGLHGPKQALKRRLRGVVVTALLLALTLSWKITCAGAAPDPMAEVQTTVNQVLAVLNDPSYKNSPKKLRDKLREIVEGHLDFYAMARSALGPHWRELSKADQDQFVDLFRRLMEDTYIGKAANYSGEKVEFLNVYRDSPDYAQVNTNILQPGHDPIKVNYRLRLEGDDWKVYDVLVDGISLISNYRTQFNRVINRDGYPKLIELVKNKVQQLDASLESK